MAGETQDREKLDDFIGEKCAQAHCKPEEAARHRRLFVKEGWDCHPPNEFGAWWALRHKEMNIISGWNSVAMRAEWDQERNYGIDREPSHIPPHQEQLAKLAYLKQLIAKIGRPMPEPLPTDYDKGAIGPPAY